MKQKDAWALYDWANSAYTTTVMAGFFPVFFKQFWATDLTVHESTFWLGMGNGVASVIIALLAPLLGAIADQGGLKKRFLLWFTAMGIIMTGALWFVLQGAWQWAIAVYILGAIGFSGSNIFYDALLVDVADEKSFDAVSSYGYALGYIGGGLLFAMNVLMTMFPDWFGLSSAAEAVRWSFLSVAVWWALFTIPLLLYVHEEGEATTVELQNSMADGWLQFKATFSQIRQLKVVFLFLLAYWLYIDGVGTVIRMAVDYGLSLGFESTVLIGALLLTQFIAFPSALAFGVVGEKLGAKTGILICIAVYTVVCIWSYWMATETDFYILAIVVGLVMGGVQALSRSFYAGIIPKSRSAEFFGFFNMLGKFAAVMGPMLMGLTSMLSGSARLSILVIVVLFIAGAFLLYFVDEEEGVRVAKQLNGKS